jgi:hypothetical protein
MLAGAGAINCTACAAGQYSNASTAACAVCAAGSVTNTLANVGSRTCAVCAMGQYSNASTAPCVSCPAGSESKLQGARSVSVCNCSAGYTANITDNLSRCSPCPANSFKAGVGSAKCTPLSNAVASVTNLLSMGVTTTAAKQLSALSDSLGTDATPANVAAREQLVSGLAAAASDPLTMDIAALSSTLELLSSLTSAVDQLSETATDDGFALVTAMASAPVGRSGCDQLASTVSNLFGATRSAFEQPRSANSGSVSGSNGTDTARTATKKRGQIMSSILEKITLTLTSNTTGNDTVFTINTSAFTLTAHKGVTLGDSISASGAQVDLPGAARRRLARTNGAFALQVVRYAGAGPHLWAGNALMQSDAEALMASDTLTCGTLWRGLACTVCLFVLFGFARHVCAVNDAPAVSQDLDV